MKIGVTLPAFVDDPEIPIDIAQRADAAGLDGVFVFDHMWRDAPPPRRGALECFALLGAVAAATRRIRVGTFVARTTLRPAATLVAALDTVQRVSDGRLIAGLGAGDRQIRAENEAFGVPFGSLDSRLAALDGAVRATRGRGYPVWVAGTPRYLRDTVAPGDAWIGQGGTAEHFAEQARIVRGIAPVGLVWSSLVLVGTDDAHTSERARTRRVGPHVLVGGPAHIAEHLRAFADAGAEWAVLAPLDAANPANIEVLATIGDQ